MVGRGKQCGHADLHQRNEAKRRRKRPLEAHPLARFIREDAEQSVMAELGDQGAGLIVQGSPGQGNWAAIPWIAVFDPYRHNNCDSGLLRCLSVSCDGADRLPLTKSRREICSAGIWRKDSGHITRPRAFHSEARAALRSDLQLMVRAYRALTFRGGLDADSDADTDLSDFN